MDAADRKQAGLGLIVAGALALVVALGFSLPACSAQDKSAGKAGKDAAGQAIAKVNGKPITEADVKASSNDAFEALEREFAQKKHDVLEQEMHRVVQDRLVEAEAAARKTTKEKVLEEIKPPEVTDAQIDAFYESKKARIQQPKEQIAPQIRDYLKSIGEQEAREKFFKALEAKYAVEYFLEPMRVQVAAAGYPTKGPTNAPVTIVEFSDFQCPYCSRLTPTLEQVMSKYGNKVRIVFRQFPLPIHDKAAKAAEAALCANEQGKFWEMHDAMFKDQSGLAVDGLKSKAATLGLNAQSFNSCLDSGKETPAVQADLKAGQQAGVQGTPAMFVNGRFINGAQPFETIAGIIDDELKRKGAS
ncbi:MAG TPA: thioredoxin domain-containing protein [Thermoanaerobaculia bacterium]|nr:thioredoxin domain-containing protein [Thermoanaerobaculia bacterium]